MTGNSQEQPATRVERTFTAVRAVLPAENAAAFDQQLEAITQADVLDLAKLDAHLRSWWHIAIRITEHPDDWRRMNEVAEEITAGRRPLVGPTLAEVLARRGIHLPE